MGTCHSKKHSTASEDMYVRSNAEIQLIQNEQMQKRDILMAQKPASKLQKPYGGRYSFRKQETLLPVPKDTVLKDSTGKFDESGRCDNDINLNFTKDSKIVKAAGINTNKFGYKRPLKVIAVVHNEISVETSKKEENGNQIESIKYDMCKHDKLDNKDVFAKDLPQVKSGAKKVNVRRATNNQPSSPIQTSISKKTDQIVVYKRFENKPVKSDQCVSGGKKEHVCSDRVVQGNSGDGVRNWGMFSRKLSKSCQPDIKSDMSKEYQHPNNESTTDICEIAINSESENFIKPVGSKDKRYDCAINEDAEAKTNLPEDNLEKAPLASTEGLETSSVLSLESDDLMLDVEIELGIYELIYGDETGTLDSQDKMHESFRADHVMSANNRSIHRRQRRSSKSSYQRAYSVEEEYRLQRQNSQASPVKCNSGLQGTTEVFDELKCLMNQASAAQYMYTSKKANRPSSFPSYPNPEVDIDACQHSAADNPGATSIFKPRRQLNIGDGDILTMDGCAYRHISQDITNVKTMLFKLKRLLQADDMNSPAGNPFQLSSLMSNLMAEESSGEPNLDKVLQKNSELNKEVLYLKKLLEEKDRTIHLLQQQMSKYEYQGQLTDKVRRLSLKHAATSCDAGPTFLHGDPVHPASSAEYEDLYTQFHSSQAGNQDLPVTENSSEVEEIAELQTSDIANISAKLDITQSSGVGDRGSKPRGKLISTVTRPVISKAKTAEGQKSVFKTAMIDSKSSVLLRKKPDRVTAVTSGNHSKLPVNRPASKLRPPTARH